MTAIGIIGTGRMGTAFARRLIECGHDLRVWNRNPDRVQEAVAAGAVAVPDLPALVAQCDILISAMTDHAALEAVFTPDAALANAAGKLFIEMSTILPDEQQALEAKALAAGARYVECPVGGTVGPALKGQLLGFAGGEEDAWQQARPVLEQMCKRVAHLGPVGTGARMKLAVNLPLAIYWATLGEAVALIAPGSMDPALIVSLIADSSAGPNVLGSRGGVVTEALGGKDQIGTFDIAGLRKDLTLALTLARREGKDLALSQTVQALYDSALSDGMGNFDGTTITRRLAHIPAT